MNKSTIDILLRAKYDPTFKELKKFVVTVLHRGARENLKDIDGERITDIQKDGFWYINNFGKEIFIPAHRVIKIKEKSS